MTVQGIGHRPNAPLHTAQCITAAPAANDTWERTAAPRPAFPADLRAQILQHPWAKPAQSRANEPHIAAAAANSAVALAAAQELIRCVWEAVRTVAPQVSQRELFGSFANYNPAADQPRYWAAGDIHPDDVPEALEHGNLRELMTMALNASYRLERHLTPTGARGVFTAPSQSLPGRSASMRRERNAGAPERTTGRETAAKLRTPQHPPLSLRERRHLRAYLEGQDVTTAEFVRLPTQLGRHRWQPRYEHPFIADAVARGLHVTAGVSGTTYRLMAMQQQLTRADAKQAKAMRLACVGYFTPDHHALHEVLTAAALFGCDYDSNAAPAQQLGV